MTILTCIKITHLITISFEKKLKQGSEGYCDAFKEVHTFFNII